GVASAAAAATAVLVYVALSSSGGGGEAARLRRPEEEDEEESKKRWPERAPASWREAAAVAARTVGFTYRETLGRWPLGDIAFGIRHYMRIQGNLQHEYTGRSCVPLEGPVTRQELIAILRYLRLCMFFAKKPYEVFLEFGGYGQSDILIRKSKARLLAMYIAEWLQQLGGLQIRPFPVSAEQLSNFQTTELRSLGIQWVPVLQQS
ncbi:Os11g0658900, partial [Oryza sativa Japonica Group]